MRQFKWIEWNLQEIDAHHLSTEEVEAAFDSVFLRGILMTIPEADHRSRGRRGQDDQIAAEPQMAPLELPPDAVPSPVETYLGRSRRRPVAVVGVVENGLVRPLDSTVKLPEHSRVIIVASEAT